LELEQLFPPSDESSPKSCLLTFKWAFHLGLQQGGRVWCIIIVVVLIMSGIRIGRSPGIISYLEWML
jgi:hypothetical protein